MGNGQEYLETGGFTNFFYKEVGTVTDGNLTAKIIAWFNTKDFHESLPRFSKESRLYMKRDRNGNIIELRVYENRRATYDFDWGHAHKNLKKGVVHVHHWLYDSNGKLLGRQAPLRYMNNSEIKEFGKLIKAANPNAKLRGSHEQQ